MKIFAWSPTVEWSTEDADNLIELMEKLRLNLELILNQMNAYFYVLWVGHFTNWNTTTNLSIADYQMWCDQIIDGNVHNNNYYYVNQSKS